MTADEKCGTRIQLGILAVVLVLSEIDIVRFAIWADGDAVILHLCMTGGGLALVAYMAQCAQNAILYLLTRGSFHSVFCQFFNNGSTYYF